MGSNREVRQELERVFGKVCMIEELGIRYIPKDKRRKLKGYTKFDDTLTYHHIKEKHFGGTATLENGALIRGYNHRWLHSLEPAQREKINQAIQKYKLENENDFIKNVGLLFTLTDGFTNLDKLVSPSAKKQVKKKLQELEHTLNNTARNSGGTLKFVGSGNETAGKSIFDQGFAIDIN